MVTSIVSVRMPPSLVQKLRELAKENHFLDVSEEIRSIIKVQLRRYQQEIGVGEERKEPTKPIEYRLEYKEVDYKTKNLVKEELIRRLKKMIEEISRE